MPATERALPPSVTEDILLRDLQQSHEIAASITGLHETVALQTRKNVTSTLLLAGSFSLLNRTKLRCYSAPNVEVQVYQSAETAGCPPLSTNVAPVCEPTNR
jgi:hypothetical protein